MNILKRHLVLTSALSCLVLTACQKQESQQKTETQHHAAEDQKSDSTEIPAFPQDCNSVDTAIKTLEKTYSPEGLNDLNILFKKCLSSVPLEKRYQWQEKSTLIYQKLIEKFSPELYIYITDIDKNLSPLTAKAKQEIFKKLSSDEKYIAKHAKELYLSKFYIGEGEYTVVQHPQYDVDIFAPYLEKSDQIYFKQIRKEYTGSNLTLDAGLSISFDEVANRLLYWENFNQNYPNNHYKKLVDDYIKQYGSALFRGDDNTRTLWFDENKIADSEAMSAIQKVAKSNSSSSPIAQKFVQLIQVNQPLWAQLPKRTYSDAQPEDHEQIDIQNQRDELKNKIQKNVDELLKPFD